jgi:iron complex transport system permease protein
MFTRKSESTNVKKGSDHIGNLKVQYSKFTRKKVLLLIVILILLLLLIIVSACIGPADLSVGDVLYALVARFIPYVEAPQFNDAVVWDLRLPRIIMGVVGGAGLAVAGAQMQGITKNPLVSPFTIGISAAAALGASVAIMFGIGFVGAGTAIIISNAFIFAMLSAIIVFGLAKLKGTSPETMILAGIALTYFFSALTSVLHFFASEEELMAMVHWTFGTLSGITWNEIGIVSIVIMFCIPILVKYSWDLNAMATGGDEAAKGLGVNTNRVRVVSLILSALITATIISFTGIIGFVGLVAPHITRFIVGGDHRFLLPGSCIIGAILMVGADTVGRTILSPIILPISIVVSFIGVPLFLYLLLTRKQNYWRK